MTLDDVDGRPGPDIPDENEVIGTSAEEDIIGRRVPFDVGAATLVAAELHQPLLDIARKTAVGNVPEFDGAVFGRRSDDVVVKRVPFDVEYGPGVTSHFANVEIQSARLLKWQNDKGSSSSHLCDDGQEFGVGGAAVGIVSVLGDFHVLVTLVFACCLTVDVTKLGGPHAAERQLSIKRESIINTTRHAPTIWSTHLRCIRHGVADNWTDNGSPVKQEMELKKIK